MTRPVWEIPSEGSPAEFDWGSTGERQAEVEPAPPVAVEQPDEVPAESVESAEPAEQPGRAARVAEAAREGDPALVAALEEVHRAGASDLHITAGSRPMIRLSGSLRAISDSRAWSGTTTATALRSILSATQMERFDAELELDFAWALPSGIRFRVNYYQQRGFMGAAFRLIPTEIRSLAELGAPAAVAGFANLVRGLVLVTGPTGSGKSTTLASIVDAVNRNRSDHIMTIEDPIEFLHRNHQSIVNQREVGEDTQSFATALKHVLRQDPDVILIGELRDLETMSVALTAAETGHLVFATLHTQSAAQTIDRMIDVFPPHQQGQVRTQLAATLRGVVCQTLMKRADGRGRVIAAEILVTTPAISNLIREGKTYQIPSALQAGRGLGMQTLDQHLAELVRSRQITMTAALEKAVDTEGFERLVQGAGAGFAGQPAPSRDLSRSFGRA